MLVGSVPTGEGYFVRGNFTGPNIWANGHLDAPFDQEVISQTKFLLILNILLKNDNFLIVPLYCEHGCRWNERILCRFSDETMEEC